MKPQIKGRLLIAGTLRIVLDHVKDYRLEERQPTLSFHTDREDCICFGNNGDANECLRLLDGYFGGEVEQTDFYRDAAAEHSRLTGVRKITDPQPLTWEQVPVGSWFQWRWVNVGMKDWSEAVFRGPEYGVEMHNGMEFRLCEKPPLP